MTTDRPPLPPIPDHAPKRTTRWRHVKSGDHCTILNVGYIEADLSIVVVYDHEHTAWVRPLGEFLSHFKSAPLGLAVQANL